MSCAFDVFGILFFQVEATRDNSFVDLKAEEEARAEVPPPPPLGN
ncbi:MAG: hypothetical protein ABWX59_05235 [Microbacteriaceae bacterium]